jgi:hypothetical protein
MPANTPLERSRWLQARESEVKPGQFPCWRTCHGQSYFFHYEGERAPPHNCLSTIVETMNYICIGGEQHPVIVFFFRGGGCHGCQNMLLSSDYHLSHALIICDGFQFQPSLYCFTEFVAFRTRPVN